MALDICGISVSSVHLAHAINKIRHADFYPGRPNAATTAVTNDTTNATNASTTASAATAADEVPAIRAVSTPATDEIAATSAVGIPTAYRSSNSLAYGPGYINGPGHINSPGPWQELGYMKGMEFVKGPGYTKGMGLISHLGHVERQQRFTVDEFIRLVEILSKAHGSVKGGMGKLHISEPARYERPGGYGPGYGSIALHPSVTQNASWLVSRDAHLGVDRVVRGSGNLMLDPLSSESADGRMSTDDDGKLSPDDGGIGAEKEARLVEEARQRITQFMVDHDIFFDRADVYLNDIRQAWSIETISEVTASANLHTLRTVASILKE